MDGLSVAASVAGVVQLADTVFTRTYRYAKTVKHATKEINELATGVRNLSSLLHGLNLVLHELEEQDDESNLSNLAEFRLHHVSSCLTTLTNIQKKLDKHQTETGEHHTVKRALRNLKWPFSVADTKELLAEVEKHKAAITVALSGDTLTTVLKALSRQEDLAADLKDMKHKQKERWAMEDHIRMDNERQDILAFFGKIDPSSNHKMSLQLRHPLTGLWLTEGLPFQTWLHSQNSKLWLSGIPGAGKTIIAASVIEEAMKESSQDRAVAYFYCDYKDMEKQNPVNILGSLASQLARQNENAFSKLEELYRVCHPKDKPPVRPEPQMLAVEIREMASCFDDVSIIVDGLDECGIHTSKVVESLVGLASDKSSRTRALFLSRDESEIHELVYEEYNHMEIAAHSEDLRLYVAAEMESRQHKLGRERLRIRSTALKEDVMKVLVEKADGMFRWVACQLDYLCSLPNDAEKRKALGSLPPGLNATYERILERVNESDESIQTMVQKALQWIVSGHGISARALCHAITIKDGDKTLDQEAIYDEDEILMHCSSLIRQSANGETLEMAHFTVKEYLCALDPEAESPYSRYSQSRRFVYPQLATVCLTYVTLDCFQGAVIEHLDEWEDQHEIEYPFRGHAVKYWVDYAQDSWENNCLSQLARGLFDPAATACFLSWARDLLYYRWKAYGDDRFDIYTRYFCAGGLKPLHMATALGLIDICRWLITSGCDVNERCNAGTPLHFALLGTFWLSKAMCLSSWSHDLVPFFDNDTEDAGRMQVLDMLIANDADCNASYQDRFGKEFSCTHLAFTSDMGRGANHPLVKLVAAGAHLKEHLLNDLERALHNGLVEEEFIEALVCKLTETNQDPSITLQAALKLKSSSGFNLIKSHPAGFTHTSIENLVDLFRSAVRFDQTQVMEELARDTRLDISGKYGYSNGTFLHNAAGRDCIGAVQLLPSLGADVNSIDEDGCTPLQIAIVYGDGNERNKQCISLLLDYGANVNTIDQEGKTAWHAAAECTNSAVAMSLLLERRANETQGLGISDEDGRIPLFIAAGRNNSSTCELLLSHESYVHQVCPEGLSLVHYGVKMCSVSILRMLQVKHFQLTEKTADGRTGLHFMSSGITLEIMQLFTDSGVDASSPALNGETPLHVLACVWPAPEAEAFDLLFNTFATEDSINSKTLEGFTPLHYALDPPEHLRGFPYDYSLTKHAEALIARGADVQIRLSDGTSCLANLVTKYVRSRTEENQNLQRIKDFTISERAVINQRLEAGRVRMQALSKLVINSTTDLEILTEFINTRTGVGVRYRPLNWFISFGDEELVDLLLEKGVDVDLRNTGPTLESSFWAVSSACWYNCPLELFRKLLRRSAALHEHDKEGSSLVHITCKPESRAGPFILEELCTSGLDPNLSVARADAKTPLIFAAASGKLDHFQILVNHGADVRAKDSVGREAAHHAAWMGHVAIIEQLLDFNIDWDCCLDDHRCNILHLAAFHGHHGLLDFIVRRSLVQDLDCRTADGVSALAFAASCGHLKATQILLKAGADTNAKSKRGMRPIHLAALSGHLDVIQQLLNSNPSLAPDDYGMTPQLNALKHGHQEVFDVLNEYENQKGADSAKDSRARTIIGQHLNSKAVAVGSKGSENLRHAIERGDFELCKALVAAGLSIHHKFRCGCTPLLYALDFNHGDIARYLVEKGASLKGRVCTRSIKVGYSLIHLASLRDESVDILRLVLAKDPPMVSSAFQSPVSPLHIAVASNNILALDSLLQHWRGRCLGNMLGEEPAESHPHNSHQHLKRERASLLSAYDAQIKSSKLDTKWVLSKTKARELSTDSFNTGSPLHLAAFEGNFEATKRLLHYGTSIDSVDKNGDTPFILACERGHVSTVRLLLDSGANPSKRDHSGRTGAMKAAAGGHAEMLKLLLDCHTELTMIDSYGWSLLHHASDGGPEVFSYLFMQGCCPSVENFDLENPAEMALWKHEEFPGFLSLIFNLDLDFNTLKRAVSHTRDFWDSCCRPMVRLFLKRAPPSAVRQALNGNTWTNGSVLTDAAKDGQEAIVELFVRAGANIELDRGPHGTPLLAACEFGRLTVVKYLIQAGAKVVSTKGGRPFSAIEAAKSFPDITRWLLVERHTEQPQIDFFSADIEEQTVCVWSGVQSVKVEIAGLYTQAFDGSSFDHAKELAKLRRALQGLVVDVFDELKDASAKMLSR